MSDDLDIVVTELGRILRMLKRGKMHDLKTRLAGVTLERPALEILGVLRDRQPLRVGAIADELQVESPHVTRHLALLERQGHVERVQDPGDRRAWLIRLTPSGLEAVCRCSEVMEGWFAEALADWPKEDLEELALLMPRLATNLDGYIQRLYEK